jgi:hypothetical protein
MSELFRAQYNALGKQKLLEEFEASLSLIISPSRTLNMAPPRPFMLG